MRSIELCVRPRVLVVALRRIGDVLLTTPLIRSLRRARADATIEVLVFSGTEGILAGNPDLDAVIVTPARPTLRQSIGLARRLWHRYDLAVSTQTGDRPAFFAFVGARRRIGLVAEAGGFGFKRLALDRAVVTDTGLHRVIDLLRLADALGISRSPEVVCPAGSPRAELQADAPYAVVHAAPMFSYKRWRPEGWREVAAALAQRGLSVMATGSPAPEERRYLDEVWDRSDIRRLDGKLSWPELAALVAGARLYLGPDTSVTHLAAASGCPTVALYGPTDPRRWGPWPVGGLQESWAGTGAVQRRGNVWLVQNPLPCVPCQQEGCERRIGSYSRCLDEMTPRQVLAAVDEALATPRGPPG